MPEEYPRPSRRWLRSRITDEGVQLWFSVARSASPGLQLSDLETLKQELLQLSLKQRTELLSQI